MPLQDVESVKNRFLAHTRATALSPPPSEASTYPSVTMMDPMAGIDGNSPGEQDTDDKDVIDVTSLRYNLERVDKIQSVMGIASGCFAGICGLTGLEGLGTF